MDIRTSTPFVIPKIRVRKEKDCAENNKSVNNQLYTRLNAPCKFDFNAEMSDPHESYFDNKMDDTKSPPYGPLVSRISNETDSIVSCLRNCSISKIEELSIENTTLKVPEESADVTLINDSAANIKTPDNTAFKNGSIERKKSTVVQPFSFEMREKLKNEHKQKELRYFQELKNERLNSSGLEPKPVPISKPPPKPCPVTKKVMETNVMKAPFTAFHSGVNIPHAQMKKNVGQKNTNQAQRIEIQPWKRKPFQVKLQKLPLTIPISPKLSTAKRALIRKLNEERSMEKEKQEIENQKKILVVQKQRGKMGMAAYRKQPDHKIVLRQNDPSVLPKRPACDPMFPQINKRRRHI